MRVFSLAALFVLALHARSVDAGNRDLGGVFAQAPSSTCAPVTTVDDPSFTLEAYAVHPWYVQQQMTVRYQPEDTLYCVRASYTLEPDGSVSVLNTANRGAVDGARQNPTLTRLRAVVADPQSDVPPSKLLVGPRFLPRFAYGPYWVVAASPEQPRPPGDPAGEGYDWALVSGGQPNIPGDTPGTCVTGTRTNDSGLWIFARDPVASRETVDAAREAARSRGFDLSVLKDVAHEGCEYPDET